MVSKLDRVDDYKYFIWKRCFHPDAYNGALPELISTNGEVVRRVVSQRQFIYVQVFRDIATGEEVVDRVNRSVTAGSALLGYSIFSKAEAVSILQTGECTTPGWVARPYHSLENSTIPTLPLSVADLPKLRLVCGAQIIWSSGARYIEAALEQRGETFKKSEYSFNLIDHIEEVTLLGQKGRFPESEELRVVPRKAEIKLDRVAEYRLEVRFPIDEVTVKKFARDKDVTMWFRVVLDAKFLCLPDDWRTFYMSVPIVDFRA